MRYGLISDIHYGFHSGNKTNSTGVNIREQDHYDAGRAAVAALKDADVDVILDAGDMAEVPAPKKRAILELINLIRFAEVPYYSVDGNHTSLKSSSDDHLYRILENECGNFKGFRRPAFDRDTRVSFVPHSYDNDEIREFIESSLHRDTEILVGHWAADNIPYVGQVAMRDLPKGVRIFLGHYHNYRPSPKHYPTYVGSTERTAWDQWDYPTGCAVFDSDTGSYTRIDIPTRRWVNVESGPNDYQEALMNSKIRDAVARLTVFATPEEYRLVDQVSCKKFARDNDAVQFTMRRKNPVGFETATQSREIKGNLLQDWGSYVREADIPKGVDRAAIVQRGADALNV